MPAEAATARSAALLAAARELAAVVLAGGVGVVTWLILVQEAWKKGYTDHEFNAAMGYLVGATGEDVRRTGFLATVAAGLAVAVVHAVLCRILRRHWALQGAVTAAIVLLAWGLVFSPLVDGATAEIPAGVFGSEAGGWTTPVMALAALVTGMAVARVHALVRSAGWWERKHFDLRESIEGIFTEEHPADDIGYRPGGFTE